MCAAESSWLSTAIAFLPSAQAPAFPVASPGDSRKLASKAVLFFSVSSQSTAGAGLWRGRSAPRALSAGVLAVEVAAVHHLGTQ